jgi:hypothetical protein
MFRGINEKLGTAGFIIAIVALVAALGGGAYAASGGLNGKQKKEVEKIAKKYSGKPGPQGPAGAAGAAGPAGAKGDAGATGSTGNEGPAGKEGVAGKEGKQGKSGITGFTETLPAGMTETGSWAVGVTPVGDTLPVRTSLSFSIPLAAALPGASVHFIKENETAPAGCTGGTAAVPTAEPGNLCVYETLAGGLVFAAILDPSSSGSEAPGAGATGAMIRFNGEEEASAYGTWAVTEAE